MSCLLSHRLAKDHEAVNPSEASSLRACSYSPALYPPPLSLKYQEWTSREASRKKDAAGKQSGETGPVSHGSEVIQTHLMAGDPVNSPSGQALQGWHRSDSGGSLLSEGALDMFLHL